MSTAMANYKDRRRVIHEGSHIGDVAEFGENDFRASAHLSAQSFPTREEAEKFLIAKFGPQIQTSQ